MEIQIQPIKVRRINDNATHCMSNGCVTPVEACRQISLTKKNTPRSVYKEHFSGQISTHSTWQLLKDGDVVVRACRSERRGDIVITGHRFSNEKFVALKQSTLDGILKCLPVEIKDWLNDIVYSTEVKAKASYLPAGYGWDGKTSIQRRMKQSGLRRMLPKGLGAALREEIIETAMVSTYRNQPSSWDSAIPMVKQINSRIKHPDIEIVNDDSHVFWVLYHGKVGADMVDMSIEVARPCKQTESWHSDYVGSKVNGVRGKSIEMPLTVQCAIKVFMKPYLNANGTGFGSAWILYKR